MQQLFFVIFFAVILHNYNVKLPETFWLHVFWSKCGTCSCSVLFRCRSFSPWWPPAFLIFSPPLRNFILFLQQKWLLCFSYLALALFLVELRWTVALLSLFLCLSLYLFSKFLDMTINLNLIIWTTRIQKHFPLSVFVFIDSFLVSASQDAGGHTLSCQNNLTCGIGLHAVGVRTVGVRTLRQNQIYFLS